MFFLTRSVKKYLVLEGRRRDEETLKVVSETEVWCLQQGAEGVTEGEQ